MEGWQLITTAPRDGRTILAYLPANAGHPTRQDVVAIFWAEGCGWATAYSSARLDAEPTHWMPLPNPPERSMQHSRQLAAELCEGRALQEQHPAEQAAPG